jgi:hypothetical protein
MVEKDKIFEGKIKQTHIFNFKELYTFLFKWLADEGYLMFEKNYSEKVTPTGKEVEIEWEARKKVSDYFRNLLVVKWRILGMTSVDAEENGKKVKLDKGQVEIKTTATLEKDYESRWENNAFSKFLRGVYDKFVIRNRIDQYQEKIYKDADEFLAQAKAFLALEGVH